MKVEAKEQLIRMVRIQNLALQTREARALVDQAPARIEEIEGRFRERNAEYVALKDRYEELEEDQRRRNAELTILEESRNKYMQDLMQVSNQREYSAMLKEIDTVKSAISGHEEAVLKDMEEIETLKPELESHAEHIKTEREKVDTERTEVEAGAREAEEQIRLATEERQQLESELPRNLVGTMARVESMRHGIFLAEVVDGTCQACFVRARPQVYQEIKAGSAVHACGSCRRFLYHKRVVEQPATSESEASGAASPGVEALNGGSV
jgi:predicted  nucleic acid-binding Zn-ribbon protein